MGFPFPWVSNLSNPRINSQSVSWWQKLSWCPWWNSPTESTNNINVLFKWMDVINWWQKLSCRPHGIFPPSCNLQFAPTLTLPSLGSHGNKQRKRLLHFDVEVCTWWDLFLKSSISFRTWWSRSCPIRTTWSSSSWSSSSLWLSTGCFLFLKRRNISRIADSAMPISFC